MQSQRFSDERNTQKTNISIWIVFDFRSLAPVSELSESNQTDCGTDYLTFSYLLWILPLFFQVLPSIHGKRADILIIFDTSLIEKLTFCFGFDCEHKRIWGEFFFFEIEGHFWYLKGRLWNMEPRFQSKRYHFHFINFLIILHSCCSLLIN